MIIYTLEYGDSPLVIATDGKGNGHIMSSFNSGDEDESRLAAAIDGIESLILSCACAGIDISEKPFKECVVTALDAAINNYGD